MEYAVSRAHDGFLFTGDIPRHADARRPIVVVRIVEIARDLRT